MGQRYDKDMSWESPATGAFAITKSDSTTIFARSLYVGSAGDVAVQMSDGSSATFFGITPGTILPIAVQKVLSTGTTATNIVGLL